MTFLKDITNNLKNNPLLCLGLIVLVIALLFYNTRLGSLFSGYTNHSNKENNEENHDTVAPAPASLDEKSQYNNLSDSAPITHNVNNQDPQHLLPKDNNDHFASVNGGNDLGNINLLKAGQHAGIDTVGSSLRNANLQIRSEPPNPQVNVSPWLNTTIGPDLVRRPLEAGEDCYASVNSM